MTTVEIDIELIGSAITELTDLAGTIDTQKSHATRVTPISLPSLSDGSLDKTVRWLRDHLEDLESRRDLAILLDTEGTGSASYTVAADTLRNVQDLLGTELSHAVDGLGPDADDETIERVSTLLQRWQRDPEVMSAMFTELGPDGTVGAMSNISAAMGYGGASDPEALQALAEQLRTGLSTASNAPGFPADSFGREIVRYSVAPLLTQDEQLAFGEKYPMGMNGANILTFLMQDTGYSDDFLLGAARTLDDFERMASDGPLDAQTWYGHNGHGPLDTGRDDLGYDDPMAAIMHNFGENPQAGLTFFTESTEDGWNRQSHYFGDRTWESDDYAGIAHAMEGIGTDPTNLERHGEDTTALVSTFFHEIAGNEGFSPEDAKGASPYLADLMKFYMPAVDTALNYGDDTGTPTSLADFEVEHLGTFEHYPLLFKGDLESLMQVAMSTQGGTERIAEGIAAYQQTQVNNIAAELARDPGNIDLRNELTDTLAGRASLQGFAEHTVGRVDIDGAASRDAQRQAFLDALSSATSLVPLPGADAVGDATSKLIKYGFSESVRLGKDEVADAWTNEAASVADDRAVRAEEGLRQVKIDTFLSLVESGVIPPEDVPSAWLDDRGRLIDTADIPEGQMPRYTQSAMDAVDQYISDSALDTTYKDQFLKFYPEES